MEGRDPLLVLRKVIFTQGLNSFNSNGTSEHSAIHGTRLRYSETPSKWPERSFSGLHFAISSASSVYRPSCSQLPKYSVLQKLVIHLQPHGRSISAGPPAPWNPGVPGNARNIWYSYRRRRHLSGPNHYWRLPPSHFCALPSTTTITQRCSSTNARQTWPS